MDLRQLETFLAVVEHRGFRRAAAALFLSQPAVSAQIRELERAVGASLFVRTPQGTVLTAVGEAMVGPAQRIVGESQRMRQLAQAAELSGTVSIGMMPGGAGELTVPLLSELAARLPGVDLQVRPLPFARCGPGVLDEVDVLLGREPFPVTGAQHTLLFAEEVYAGMPLGVEAAEAHSLTVAEAAELTFVTLATILPAALRDYWSLATLTGGWRVRTDGPPAVGPLEIRDRVDAGFGMALAPASVRRAIGFGRMRFVPMADMPPSQVMLVSRPGLGEVVEAVHREGADIAARLVPLLLGEGLSGWHAPGPGTPGAGTQGVGARGSVSPGHWG